MYTITMLVCHCLTKRGKVVDRIGKEMRKKDKKYLSDAKGIGKGHR